MTKSRERPADVMRRARKKSKKTQAQLAAELDVTQACISRWETGDAFPHMKDIEAVAKVYGVRAELLIPFEAKAS